MEYSRLITTTRQRLRMVLLPMFVIALLLTLHSKPPKRAFHSKPGWFIAAKVKALFLPEFSRFAGCFSR
ncbi:hypothetical protein [Novosphingobium sp. CECT 9465]|uniref:hypothetical protein n=1 Tax=Novosphingobium sp. CECT 9465 TaxID=2829794 RepID=UPI001E552323|nr:hypothetical protein [Novosphingobium sp. CECT 9465]